MSRINRGACRARTEPLQPTGRRWEATKPTHLFNLIYMEDYEIIEWPEIQYFMDIEGFDDNATLIEENDAMGIGSSTYLVSKDWLKSLEE